MRISDWSSDVCSSDLDDAVREQGRRQRPAIPPATLGPQHRAAGNGEQRQVSAELDEAIAVAAPRQRSQLGLGDGRADREEGGVLDGPSPGVQKLRGVAQMILAEGTPEDCRGGTELVRTVRLWGLL